jgi:valyl-tRNA synthetase
MQPKMEQKIDKATRKEFPEGIPSYGTDALRFTFCSVASYTREIRFDTNRLGGYRNFCNKLWNASRYVMMNTEEQDTGIDTKTMALSLPDRWILSRLQKTISAAQAALAQFRYDLFAQVLYDFTWNEFCDWYLELSKPILTSSESSADMLRGTRHTLVNVLEALLRLLHPIMPFITEEIWQRIAPLAGKDGKTIMLQSYPQANAQCMDEQAVNELEWVKSIVIAIRTIRSEMNIAPGKPLPILLRKGNKADKSNAEKHQRFLTTLAKIESLTWLAHDETPPPSASAFVGELEIYIPMAGFINKEEETQRLNKEITKLEKELLAINNKLTNPQFVDKAPADVVEKERIRLKETQVTAEKLRQQLTLITTQ